MKAVVFYEPADQAAQGNTDVIAGLAHDHLFVGWEQGEQARALLSDL